MKRDKYEIHTSCCNFCYRDDECVFICEMCLHEADKLSLRLIELENKTKSLEQENQILREELKSERQKNE